MRLPWRGVMLANPGLGVSELVKPAQCLKVPVMACLQPSLRRMRGHGEIAELHGVASFAARSSYTSALPSPNGSYDPTLSQLIDLASRQSQFLQHLDRMRTKCRRWQAHRQRHTI